MLTIINVFSVGYKDRGDGSRPNNTRAKHYLKYSNALYL